MERLRILLIEDDGFLAGIYASHLEQEGFDTLRAGNGQEGVDMAHKEQPDLILLDIALPKKNGFEVLDELKADGATQRIPIVMLTNLSAQEDIKRCLKNGACEYLIKSQHSPQDVVLHVRRALKIAAGFTLPELLVVMGVIAIALVGAIFAWVSFSAKARDVERLDRVEHIRAGLLAAAQEPGLRLQCPDSSTVKMSLLAACRICASEECTGADDRTQDFLPAALLDGTLSPNSTLTTRWFERLMHYFGEPWRIGPSDREGSAGVPSLSFFTLYFSLERGQQDGRSSTVGIEHTMDETGQITETMSLSSPIK